MHAKLSNYAACIQLLSKKSEESRADVNARDEGNEANSALHFASANGNVELVHLLLYHSAIIDAVNAY